MTRKFLGFWSATALVVTSMIGTGVFTTAGFQVRDVGDPRMILALWGLGGLLALCGAVSYAELSAMFARNGAEYALITRAFHPAPGFVAGVVGVFAGFAGPTAASALGFGTYLHAAAPGVPPVPAAVALVLGSAVVHGVDPRFGGRWQTAVTAVELGLIASFAGIGLVSATVPLAARPLGGAGAVAVALVYVSYAYSGWNTSSYVAGELHDPSKTGPRSLLVGTAIVTMLYLALNAAFLESAPASALAGQLDVGAVAATAWLGPAGGRACAAVVAWCLSAMVGAMLVAGPRLIAAIGEDYPRLSWLARRSARGVPVNAVALQTTAALAMVLGISFEDLLTWMGLLLAAASALTVLAVPWLRWQEPSLERPYRAPFSPITPLLYVALTLLMIAAAILEKPVIGAAAVGVCAASLGLWAVVRPPGLASGPIVR
jgi:APA family basic amino acid/polyamine antiporter